MDSEVWISTEPSTQVKQEREARAKEPSISTTKAVLEDELGAFARLIPQNRYAREAFQRLLSNPRLSGHHRQFVRLDERPDVPEAKREHYFLFSLGLLPEFPTLGWRLGRGRTGLPNQGVDILIEGGEDVAGCHVRFAWVNGGGGFFVFADNLNGKEIILNGEVLQRTQRMVPFRNSLSIGECNFTIKFQERDQDQEDQFQVELAAFYRRVLRGEVPIILPTPSGNEIVVGDWVVRSPISSGANGRVSLVTHRTTGKPAAAKELWLTRRNRNGIECEVAIAKKLRNWNHKRLGTPFEIFHRPVYNGTERARIVALLDASWYPSVSDATDLYILYTPLSTSTFGTLITSNASEITRTQLFAQVLEGLDFLHQNGIAHRDIKPANLTVRSYDPPDAQIIDFGSASFESPILYDRCGTIPYLAPEQKDREFHTQAVDIWAAALVGVELIGFRKSAEKVTEAVYRDIRAWLGKRAKHPLAPCCMAMLRYESTDRLSAAEALDSYLKGYIEPDKSTKRSMVDEDKKLSAKRYPSPWNDS